MTKTVTRRELVTHPFQACFASGSGWAVAGAEPEPEPEVQISYMTQVAERAMRRFVLQPDPTRLLDAVVTGLGLMISRQGGRQ